MGKTAFDVEGSQGPDGEVATSDAIAQGENLPSGPTGSPVEIAERWSGLENVSAAIRLRKLEELVQCLLGSVQEHPDGTGCLTISRHTRDQLADEVDASSDGPDVGEGRLREIAAMLSSQSGSVDDAWERAAAEIRGIADRLRSTPADEVNCSDDRQRRSTCPSCGSVDRFCLGDACAKDSVEPHAWHRGQAETEPAPEAGAWSDIWVARFKAGNLLHASGKPDMFLLEPPRPSQQSNGREWRRYVPADRKADERAVSQESEPTRSSTEGLSLSPCRDKCYRAGDGGPHDQAYRCSVCDRPVCSYCARRGSDQWLCRIDDCCLVGTADDDSLSLQLEIMVRGAIDTCNRLSRGASTYRDAVTWEHAARELEEPLNNILVAQGRCPELERNILTVLMDDLPDGVRIMNASAIVAEITFGRDASVAEEPSRVACERYQKSLDDLATAGLLVIHETFGTTSYGVHEEMMGCDG